MTTTSRASDRLQVFVVNHRLLHLVSAVLKISHCGETGMIDECEKLLIDRDRMGIHEHGVLK